MIYSPLLARCPLRYRGLTLIELLVVIGIIAVLAGIIWVVFAPAREKARLIHCINNFRQIHLALEAYRQEWDGVDVEVAQSFADLGLPPSPCRMVGKWPYLKEECLVGTPEIWTCPISQRRYGYAVAQFEAKEFMEGVLRRRQGEYPIVFDHYHNVVLNKRSLKVIILRLNGKIEIKNIDLRSQPSWEW